ncbi:MAG: hypothetical protein HQL98_16215 [Magnetococcales bacterium]|nr:hypothetical protein [Magnetococcales bacterium]
MKRLGDLFLPDSIQWKNQYEWAPVAQEMARTLGGQNVVWGSALVGGRPIDLEAADDVTWLTHAQVEAIQAMATQAGGVFDLVLDDATFHVMFRHQDPPAISFMPIWPHARLFHGVVKLMTM